MMKAAVAIDDWKLPIFQRHLSAAGYTYDGPTVFSPGVLILQVHCESAAALEIVVRAANNEAQQRGK